jgi:hypothetical protein
MLDHFGPGISCDQTCKWGIEWDTCARGLSVRQQMRMPLAGRHPILGESGLALLQILHFRLDDVVLDGVHQTAYPRRTSIGEMFEHGKPFDQTAEQALRRLVSRAQSASVIGVWPRSSGGSSRIGGPITAAESRAGSSRPSTPLGRPGAWTAGIGAWGRPCE